MNFDAGASGKSADKIKVNLEQIQKHSISFNLYFVFLRIDST